MTDLTTSADDTSRRIHAVLALADAPVSVSEVAEQLQLQGARQVSARTIARRLVELQNAGLIAKQGTGKNTRYVVSAKGDVPDDRAYPTLSLEAESARARVRRPLIQRSPVGYEPALLRRYRPGTDWYLSDRTRAQLHEAGRTDHAARPAGTFARDIYERLLIDLSWSSSRLEGNTYSLLETQELIARGARADGKSVEEAQMILNHKNAIAMLVDRADEIGFNRYTICNLHAALSENLLAERADEGRLRTRPVQISATTYVPTGIPQVLEEMFNTFLGHASAIQDPFEKAFFAMVHIPYLQPFIDVNKRTSRLAANIPLVASNYCPLSFIDVPERAYVEGTVAVYENQDISLLRDVFVWAYLRSAQQYHVVRNSVAQPDPFRLRYRDALGLCITEIVRGLSPGTEPLLTRWSEENGIPAEDQAQFVALARALIEELHEGLLARYGLRPSEYSSWKVAMADG
ncbi:MAG: Fic family protein [Gemmatimonadaceae bacterium]|nr:Fic family protein [Gemmatimonadaceae bacterium]